METILLAVTIASLLVALVMSAAAWRVSREERQRRAARVAALAAAASAPESPGPPRVAEVAPAAPEVPEPTVVEPQPVSVTIEPRTPWIPSRVSTFAPARTVAASASRMPDRALNSSAHELPLRPAAAPIADTFLGGDARRPSERRQRGLAIAAAILFATLGGGAYWMLAGNDRSSASADAGAGSATAPLELMSLRHERTGSRLSLSGLVRNPSGGAPIEGLTAVVFLFDAQGTFISSARTGVDFKHLAPGDESPFVITVDAPAKVARYRVSFRTDAGILTHVDRRSEQSATTAIAGSKS